MRPPALQELTNPGMLLGRATRSPKGDVSKPSPFGMTTWFTVFVPSLDSREPRSLGGWSACSGLEVTMTPEGPFDEGGNYTSPQYLPGKIGYNKVTLERVMTPDGARRMHDWLEDLSTQWVNGKPTLPARAPVVVALYNGVGPNAVKVHSWELRNAFPVSWSVPSFSTAGGGGFALEKLVLQHSGFLKPVHIQPGGRLELVDAAKRKLSFLYNPGKVVLKKSREAATGKKKLSAGTEVVDADSLGITLSDLRLDGTAAIETAIPLLRHWVELDTAPDRGGPQQAPKAPAKAGKENKCGACGQTIPASDGEASGTPRPLDVVWGPSGGGMPSRTVLKSFDLSITRFTPDGTPSRATVSLTLQEFPDKQARFRPLTIGERASWTPAMRPAARRRQPGARPEDPLRAGGGVA